MDGRTDGRIDRYRTNREGRNGRCVGKKRKYWVADRTSRVDLGTFWDDISGIKDLPSHIRVDQYTVVDNIA